MVGIPGKSLTQQVKIDERRRQVIRYALTGDTDSQIAEKLGVHPRTVFKDRAAIYKKNISDLSVGEEAVSRLMTEFKAVITEHWRLYEMSLDDAARARALSGIIKALDSRAKLMQSFGLLPKAPERVELDARVVTCDVLMMILAELGKELPDEHRGPFFAKVRERLNGS